MRATGYFQREQLACSETRCVTNYDLA